ncbi:MAG TPA: hypothetical protein VLC93_06050 [Myxococcota bacterium]|nr:hypothetical protein [Myxococcota bacterium]
MTIWAAMLFALLGDAVVVPCSDVPPAPTFVGPPLPTCKPSPELLQDLELLRELDLLENWEVLGD